MNKTDMVSTDSNGFVQIKLDVPAGASVVQQLPSNSLPTHPPVNPNVTLPPVLNSSESLVSNEMPDSSSTGSPYVQQIQEKFTKAQSKQEDAKQQVEEALKQVKKLEDKVKHSQAELQKTSIEAQEQITQAQEQIKSAQATHQEGDQQLKQIESDDDTGNTKSIGGFKPLELVQALSKPPQPNYASTASGGSSDFSVDKDQQQEVRKHSEAVQQKVKLTETQIKLASRELKKSTFISKLAHKRESKIFQKLGKILSDINSSGEEEVASLKLPHIFTVMGAALLFCAVLLAVVSGPLIGIVIALLAFTQFGMSVVLKKKSQ